ncbi:extracellular solute-binding protein [Glaciecola sp. XM2]|uniref:extracellular solute-binding protein n=1 Tax=Glaciecola sp. XM2 TaxID=1914931 RepID=UPI0020323C30|nr:extracellular solute-binding protein [Glaciecola sp. XM2]
MEVVIKKFIFASILASLLIPSVVAQEVNVYSGRQEALIKPLLDKFSERTGIEVNLVTGGSDALISRLQSEGDLSPADIIIMADAGRLVRAEQLGLTQAVTDEALIQTVPEAFKADNNHWIALTKRARPIMYRKGDVSPDAISTLAELGTDAWKNEVCIRSSSNIYNQSMTASLILLQGEEATLAWSKALVGNFARSPKGGDRDQIKAVVAGECKLAVANTYYLGGMLTSADEETRAIAEQVGVIWPDQDTTGTHINISGAAITKYAQNTDEAQALLAFMLEADSQQWYAQVNHEYPLLDGVEWSKELQSFGTFKAQDVDFEKMGAMNGEALRLMDKAGWR